MKAFRFRLEAALRLRQLQAQSERSKLGQLLAERERLERSLAAVAEQRAEAAKFVQGALAPDAADLRALSSFILGSNARAKNISETIARIEAVITNQRMQLRKAEQNEKSITKLREKKWSEWTLQGERENEAIVQELWLLSHTTNKDDR